MPLRAGTVHQLTLRGAHGGADLTQLVNKVEMNMFISGSLLRVPLGIFVLAF